MVEGGDLHDTVDDATQGSRQGGHALGPVYRVGDDDDVGGQLLLVAGDDRLHGGGADLLLTLDEEGDADRRLAVEGTDGSQVGSDATLVVSSATPEETLSPGGGDEGVGVPLVEVAGGLDVTVGVQQNGGLALGGRPVSDDSRQPVILGDDVDVGGASLPGGSCDEFGSGPHIVGFL